MGRYQLTPLSYEGLDHAASFASDQCTEGVCAIAKSSLRILTIERLGEVFNQQVWLRAFTGVHSSWLLCN